MIQLDLPIPELSLDCLVHKAVETIRTFCPKDRPYWGCFSGGKDSVVIKELGRLSGVPIEWHYNVTTIDPPELCKFIRYHHPEVIWERSKYGNFFKRILVNGFPTRIQRWCCKEFKESQNPKDRRIILGVRAAESPRRAATWNVATRLRNTMEYAISPILYWSNRNVWNFIHERSLEYCCLYDEGFKRLGCIGCPMAKKQRFRQFARWPRYEELWKRAFRRLWEKRAGTSYRGKEWFGSANFSSWEEMWEWWMNDKPLPNDDECILLDLMGHGE